MRMHHKNVNRYRAACDSSFKYYSLLTIIKDKPILFKADLLKLGD
jgi:hypothetical protein